MQNKYKEFVTIQTNKFTAFPHRDQKSPPPLVLFEITSCSYWKRLWKQFLFLFIHLKIPKKFTFRPPGGILLKQYDERAGRSVLRNKVGHEVNSQSVSAAEMQVPKLDKFIQLI